MVLALARPSEAWCFPIRQLSFEQKEQQQQQQQQQPAAAGLDGVFPSGNCFFECVSVEKYCVSRISDDTLGSFLARFWSSFRGMVFSPGS